MNNLNEHENVSENVVRILNLIKNKEYNKKELHSFYENINNEYKGKITDYEFEILIQTLNRELGLLNHVCSR